jgi:hypothetical protein
MNILKQFLQEVNSIGFWGRIFGWTRIKQLLTQAFVELEFLTDASHRQESTITDLKSQLEKRDTELRIRDNRILELDKQSNKQEAELNQLRHQLTELRQTNTLLQNDEKKRIQERDQALSNLAQIQDKVQADHDAFLQREHQKELDRLERMRETWQRHQEATRERIKSLCQKHTIEYVEEVPFKGDPDNTVRICNEYIVFDAKSPAGDDLSNFPNYLKGQAEKANKYSKQDGVKKDIFFVVPSNTIQYLTQFVYNHAEHDVYILAADALEPVLLNLQKLENYEFAKELSPEEHANICRVIGRFAHLSKRRIQVDNYFANQTLELAYQCENTLPEDMMEQVRSYECADKLNPPMERRSKSIPVAGLEKDTKRVQREAEGRGVLINSEQVSENMNEIPLYKE